MADDKDYLASWENQEVIEFFTSNRNALEDVYPSERHFLDRYLRSDMTVLDYGCAAGGFCNILETGYHLPPENYRGLDQSSKMIDIARRLYPKARFYTHISQIQQEGEKLHLIFSFGVLHMTLDWEEILRSLYDLSSEYLIFDLRVAKDGPSVEDIARSYQTLSEGTDRVGSYTRVPYVILNQNYVESRLKAICNRNDLILRFGYSHPVSGTVTSPYKEVEMTVFCIIKDGAQSPYNSGGRPAI